MARQAELKLTCAKHPRYKAVRRPTATGCPCGLLYDIKQLGVSNLSIQSAILGYLIRVQRENDIIDRRFN